MMLEPIKREFAVYETTIFEGKSNSTVNYNQTFSIPNEGVFSTFFLFGKHHPVEVNTSFDEDIGSFVDDIFGEDEDAKTNNNNRVLLPSDAFDTKSPHLILNGQISFVNSFGFLNADQYPLMQFFLVMFFFYMLASGYWIRLMH